MNNNLSLALKNKCSSREISNAYQYMIKLTNAK